MSKPFDIRGLAFGNVRFSTSIKQGKGVRAVEIDVDAETILRLADCIRGCPEVWEEPSSGAKPRSVHEALTDERFEPVWIGHAVWHMEHPHALMPCLPTGATVIEARESAPALEAHVGDNEEKKA